MSISTETSFDWEILSALNDLHTKSFERARETCERVLQTSPEHAHATHLLGLIADHQNQPDEAISLLKASIALKPDEASFYFNQGMVYEKQGRYEDAIAAFSHAIATQPDYLQAHFQLGLAQLKAEQWEPAQQAFEYILDQQPDFELREYLRQSKASEATLHHYQGLLALAAGQDVEAEQAYQRALSLEPQHAKAQLGLAKLYLQQERMEQAQALLKTYLEQGQTPEALSLLAHIHTHKRQYAEAISLLKQALEQDPHALDLRLSLAYNYLYARQLSESLAAWQAVSLVKWRQHGFLQQALQQIQSHPDAGHLFKQKLTADYQGAEHLWGTLEPEVQKRKESQIFKDFCVQALNTLDNWKAQHPPTESLWGLNEHPNTEPFEPVHTALFEQATHLFSLQLEQCLPQWSLPLVLSKQSGLALSTSAFQQLERDFLAYFPPFASVSSALSAEALQALQDFYANFPLANVFWQHPYVLHTDLSDGILHPLLWQLALELQHGLPQLLQHRWLKDIWLEQLLPSRSGPEDYAIQASTEHLLIKIWLQTNPGQEEIRIFDARLPSFQTQAQTNVLLADQRGLKALLQSQAKKVYTLPSELNRLVILQGNLLHQHCLVQPISSQSLCLSFLFGPE